jgi:threonylcarbamoyladenosine tRNA methylthiotransferase MtaB
MRARLADAGWCEVDAAEDADVVVVNTCTVTALSGSGAASSCAPSRGVPFRTDRRDRCYAQRAPDEVAAIDGVSLVLGVANGIALRSISGAGAEGARARRACASREALCALAFPLPAPSPRYTTVRSSRVAPARAKRAFAASSPVSFGRTRALLKVQDGATRSVLLRCSLCARAERSLPLDGAVAQAARLLEAGFHEIVVTGADLGAYGADLGRPGLCGAGGADSRVGDRASRADLLH